MQEILRGMIVNERWYSEHICQERKRTEVCVCQWVPGFGKLHLLCLFQRR